MKESRVSKYQEYRDSISKEGSKVFSSPSNKEQVSPEMRLFLKIERKKIMENLLVIALILAISITLLVYGIKLF